MRQWLRRLRQQKGLTQEQVAELSNMSRAYYAQIELGERTPSFEVAMSLARVLGFSVSAFYSQELKDSLALTIRDAGVMVAHCDRELRYTWIHNPHPEFDATAALGKRDDELSDSPGTQELMNIKRLVIQEGRPVRRLVEAPLPSVTERYLVFAEPLLNQNEEVVGVVTLSLAASGLNVRSGQDSLE